MLNNDEVDQKLDISAGNEDKREEKRHEEVCNSDFINAGNICFYLSQNQVTMSQAKSECQEKGAKIWEEKSSTIVIKKMVLQRKRLDKNSNQ